MPSNCTISRLEWCPGVNSICKRSRIEWILPLVRSHAMIQACREDSCMARCGYYRGWKILRSWMSSCASHRTHLLHARLSVIMPRNSGHYHVTVGHGGQPITAPRHYPIEHHGEWVMVTHPFTVVSSTLLKFMAPMVDHYNLSALSTLPSCYTPSATLLASVHPP
jgi:hypothetical protein